MVIKVLPSWLIYKRNYRSGQEKILRCATIDIILQLFINDRLAEPTHFRVARPQHRISVLLKSGLTNFSGSTDKAIPLTSKENGAAFMNAAE
ncbi:hypothetical protein [Pedobacter sp. KACC 23697]|uniref:Uncharacterized protein n=1 Tax=Pedobacter sp. KACC 23697 TaxID=3149230 RepID=A0AAU7K9T9_9SPHI